MPLVLASTQLAIPYLTEFLSGDAELDPTEERVLLRQLLGDAAPRDDEAIVFQNVPTMRSIPTIAHSHVFLRPRADEAGECLQRRLNEVFGAWESRLPWHKMGCAKSSR